MSDLSDKRVSNNDYRRTAINRALIGEKKYADALRNYEQFSEGLTPVEQKRWLLQKSMLVDGLS